MFKKSLITAIFAFTNLAFASSHAQEQQWAQELASAVPKGVKLVIAEQSDQFSIPWKLSGHGKDAPYQVNFSNFNGGPAVIEALVSGAVDVGFIGEAPLPIAISAGVNDLVAIAALANPGSPGNIFLAVQPNSSIKSVEDLAGKSIAYPPGTGRHMILSGILHSAGLSLDKDVNGIQLAGTEVAPTFASGSVDAAIVLGQQLFRLGNPPVIGDGTGHNWGINLLVARKSSLNDPGKQAALADLIRRVVKVNNWQQNHIDEWIQATYVKQQGLTPEQGKYLYEKSGLGFYYPIDNRLIEIIQEISDGLYQTGALKKKIDVQPYIDNRFNQIVELQNKYGNLKAKPLINETHNFVTSN